MRAAAKSRYVLAACLCVLLSIFTSAQTQTTGRIAGTVRDAQGAAITRADIIAEHAATGERWTATTDESGSFVILSLTPGSYNLRAQALGFASTLVPGVSVTLADTTSLNVVLQVAQADVEINVNDAPPLVITSGSNWVPLSKPRACPSCPLPAAMFFSCSRWLPA